MPAPFSLPLAASQSTQNAQISSTPSSRARRLSQPIRKRKRALKHDTSSEDEINISSDSGDDLAASANPLSLTQDDILQRKLAGLGLSEPAPSDDITDFPHRPLPVQKSELRPKNRGRSRDGSVSGTEDESGFESANETEDERIQETTIKRPAQGHRLRLQHFSVLTTILHRCLNEGDIERASRAWAMLIRMQISGKAIDLKMSGYWGIGAELLVRSLDGKKKRSSRNSDFNPELQPQNGEKELKNVQGERRWGTKEGLQKAISYYERLILEFPYRRHHDKSVSALDFWPAMVGCEIYGIETERKEALSKLQAEEDEDEGDIHSGSETDASPEPESEDERGYGNSRDRKLREKRLRRRAERRWISRDDVRRVALAAVQKLAARLDVLMATPPYADSHNMLRLRGNIAVYQGDLCVPLQMVTEEEDGDADRRQLLRQRRREREGALKRQQDEQRKARVLFDRVFMEKGDLDGDLGFRNMEIEELDEQMEM